MVRVKRGTIAIKRRRKILKYAKGFRWGRKSKERLAREALLHAWRNAYRGRKMKKRSMRGLWQTQISAAARQHDLSYSKLMGLLKKQHIELDRKVLASLAKDHPSVFARVVEKVK